MRPRSIKTPAPAIRRGPVLFYEVIYLPKRQESFPLGEQVRVTEAGAVALRQRIVAVAVAEAPEQLELPRTSDHVDLLIEYV